MAQDKPTLCWKCAHACGGCSWSDSFTPVDGWTAKQTKIKHDFSDGRQELIDSYRVDDCPLFENDETHYRPNKKIAPLTRTFATNQSRKSPRRLAIEALPLDELDGRIDKLPNHHNVARYAFEWKMTLEQIAEATGHSLTSVKKILRVTLARLEAMA